MKRISSTVLAPVIVAVFSGGILVSMALNLWATESRKVAAAFSSGEFRGLSDPADIRGSYTLSDIASNFSVPVAVLARAFGADASADPSAFQVKELEGRFPPAADGGEIGTDSVRLFTARYLGLPFVPGDSTRLPATAVELLRDRLSPADFAELQDITVRETAAGSVPAEVPAPEVNPPAAKIPALQVNPPAADAPAQAENAPPVKTAGADPGTAISPANGTASPEHSTAEGRTVTGNTTFYDLLSWGVSRETVSRVLGRPMGRTSATIRDFCRAEGLSFSEMKAQLQAEIPMQ